MKLGEIVAAAGKFYPEDFIARYFDPVRERVCRLRAGDTLAGFIVAELLETYDKAAQGEAQVDEAVRVLEHAKRDLESSLRGLRELRAVMPVLEKE
ncbi:MAG TPA: hypothetical protein VKU80_06445 [Planctomycetota bacterium]|nr:hypothetical protein [Planctomycetota bacterium]